MFHKRISFQLNEFNNDKFLDTETQVKGTTPFDLANEFAHPELAELLLSYGQIFDCEVGGNIKEAPVNGSPADGNVMAQFHAKYNQEFVNFDLILEVLNFVDSRSTPGTRKVLK